ncbi:hypothetical protein M595_2206 [Lyngbya aestuarii BL J]|uniref:Uncharacterized protein n=1 Tax=Lyngbya aestuarii BL J TaxID=1348334 RepID=U7QIP0_9CYAN|nr:hypothetical protein M595_2206 [Lyngbya aestuarii BL J]
MGNLKQIYFITTVTELGEIRDFVGDSSDTDTLVFRCEAFAAEAKNCSLLTVPC